MILRRAKQEDGEAIWHVHTQAIREIAKSHYTQAQVEAWAGRLTPQSYRKSIESRDLFVAEDTEGSIMGFGQLNQQIGEVEAVYVHPAYRRRGVGRQLLQTLEEVGRQIGLTALHLDSSLNAVAFYEYAGFTAEWQGTHILGNGVELSCMRMTKALSVETEKAV